MIRNHVDDEFIAVRVQDPRVQNEGSWNSYIDYKIFLHTNSKAFTAKTSCVRRRYSEFEWLKKNLQKNAGLVPVPDLPGKSFYFNNEDFLERRRKGLQVFLKKVLEMTVFLSDSQLHLFLQTQLPISHIQDCVQGHTPYSVMDAILTYASSNRGLAQAQEEESIREHSFTISYESMESPAPHQPNPTCNSQSLPCGEADPLEDILELSEQDSGEILHKEAPSIRISQKSNHLEAVEVCDSTQATFYLGEMSDDSGSLSSADQMDRRSCLIETPVQVHSPMETDGGADEERVVTVNTEGKTEDPSDSKENTNIVDSGSVSSEEILGLREKQEEVLENNTESEYVCCENLVIENQVKTQVSENDAVEVKSGRETDLDVKISDESGRKELEIHEESLIVNGDESEEVQHSDGYESDGDSHSLPSSNESVGKYSKEERVCEETEFSSPEDLKNWTEAEASSRNILDLNGCVEEQEASSGQEDEDQQHVTNTSGLSDFPELKAAAADGGLSENCGFSILESSCLPRADDGKVLLSSPSLDGSEAKQGVEVR